MRNPFSGLVVTGISVRENGRVSERRRRKGMVKRQGPMAYSARRGCCTMAMHEQDRAMLKSLIAVAWADGRFAAEEKEMLEALISAFNASEIEAEEMRRYATNPRSIDDVPITELSADDRRTLLNHAVVLTFIDGQQSDSEKELLGKLADRLRIGEAESKRIIDAAEARAKRLLELL
jgi:tellurite resistance protein